MNNSFAKLKYSNRFLHRISYEQCLLKHTSTRVDQFVRFGRCYAGTFLLISTSTKRNASVVELNVKKRTRLKTLTTADVVI